MSTAPLLKKIYRIDRAEIGYLRFILESYDGLAFVRTIESRLALVEIAYPPSRRHDAEPLLASLQTETGMTEAAIPADVDYTPL